MRPILICLLGLLPSTQDSNFEGVAETATTMRCPVTLLDAVL